MNIENTKAQMRKGVLEFCILSVLKEKDAYTSETPFRICALVFSMFIIPLVFFN